MVYSAFKQDQVKQERTTTNIKSRRGKLAWTFNRSIIGRGMIDGKGWTLSRGRAVISRYLQFFSERIEPLVIDYFLNTHLHITPSYWDCKALQSTSQGVWTRWLSRTMLKISVTEHHFEETVCQHSACRLKYFSSPCRVIAGRSREQRTRLQLKGIGHL